MRQDHDSQYKDLFSNSTLVAELLHSFVDEEFVQHLDFSTLEKQGSHFVTGKYRKREADVIYKIQFHGEPVYIYLLIEFQSSVDRLMSLRLLEYIVQFYKDLLKLENRDALPPVFPLVLYSGDRKWSAPIQFKNLVAPSSMPGKYIPNFRYYKIAINEISKERLRKIRNAVASIFFVEKSSPAELAGNIRQFVQLIKNEKPEVTQLITDWFLSTQNLKVPKKKISSLQDLTEVTTMWATAVKEHESKVRESATTEAEQQILINQIEIKFGLPAQARRKILRATDSHKIVKALRTVVTASSRQEVLKCLD